MGERELPTPGDVYVQVLRAVIATTGTIAAFMILALVRGLVEGTGTDHRVAGAVGLLMLLVGAWAILECVFAAGDLRALPPSWERLTLQITVGVMIAGNMACAVAIATLAIVAFTG